MLLEELGIDPSEELKDLEAAVLRQDPSLLGAGHRAAGDHGAATRVLAAPSSVAACLRFADGSVVELDARPCVIGRSEECQVHLDDPNVSRRHARIRLVEGSFVLSDLGSTNGTIVNGRTADDHVLESGDELTFGGITAVFERQSNVPAT